MLKNMDLLASAFVSIGVKIIYPIQNMNIIFKIPNAKKLQFRSVPNWNKLNQFWIFKMRWFFIQRYKVCTVSLLPINPKNKVVWGQKCRFIILLKKVLKEHITFCHSFTLSNLYLLINWFGHHISIAKKCYLCAKSSMHAFSGLYLAFFGHLDRMWSSQFII